VLQDLNTSDFNATWKEKKQKKGTLFCQKDKPSLINPQTYKQVRMSQTNNQTPISSKHVTSTQSLKK